MIHESFKPDVKVDDYMHVLLLVMTKHKYFVSKK